ncbi:MAG: hypothetical protein EXR59_01075 [Dehalococcoidia bacterium]|nr:hypothetical protein [Dehalococcoidia bacterium]
MRRFVLAAAFASILVMLPGYAFASASLQVEQHPTNLRYIFAAFMAIWAGYFLYALFMGWRELKLRRYVEELQTLLKDRAKKS